MFKAEKPSDEEPEQVLDLKLLCIPVREGAGASLRSCVCAAGPKWRTGLAVS
jgi:hypothetical protein